MATREHGKPIFIGGTGRSGTTLMQVILNTHKDVAAFGEVKVLMGGIINLQNMFKQPAYKRHRLVIEYKKLWLTDYFRFYVPWDSKKNKDGLRGLTCWFSRKEVEQCITILDRLRSAPDIDTGYAVFGDFVCALFSIYAQKEGKKFWAEKTPPNAVFAPFLQKALPDMKLINMVRDGRDVTCSVGKVGWAIEDPYKALDWWAKNLVSAVKVQKCLKAGTVINVRYEDVIQKREPVLRRVTEFLGIEWDETVLKKELFSKSVYRYKKEMDPAVQKYAVEKYGDLLRMFNYET